MANGQVHKMSVVVEQQLKVDKMGKLIAAVGTGKVECKHVAGFVLVVELGFQRQKQQPW